SEKNDRSGVDSTDARVSRPRATGLPCERNFGGSRGGTTSLHRNYVAVYGAERFEPGEENRRDDIVPDTATGRGEVQSGHAGPKVGGLQEQTSRNSTGPGAGQSQHAVRDELAARSEHPGDQQGATGQSIQ